MASRGVFRGIRSMSTQARYLAGAAAAVVTVSVPLSTTAADADHPGKNKAHHVLSGGKTASFTNPWDSFHQHSMGPSTMFNVYRDWKSHPIPPPEELPAVVTPDWGLPEGTGPEGVKAWRGDVKTTWLGHACFLLEFPAINGERGPRASKLKQELNSILYDPIFSQRCSPVQFMGPARVTQPPIKIEDLPHVDAVIISHNHYDHTDSATIKAIYKQQPAGTVHFFSPLATAKWFHSVGVAKEHVTELDWWDARDLTLQLPSQAGNDAPAEARTLTVTCTPCQHFSGRGVHDRHHTLWASWVVEDPASSSKSWFGGDTGYKAVPRGATTEEGLPTCPVFKEIGERFGPFDISMIPIGAYDPRWMMSPVHCAPEDSVHLHLDVKSKKSVGMHWATWVLTCEPMTEPPQRLRKACQALGIADDAFITTNIGETTRVTPIPK